MKITPSKIIAATVLLSSILTAFIMLNPETTKDVNIYKYTSGGNSTVKRTSTETIISMVEKPVEEEPSSPANGGLGAQGVAGPSGAGATPSVPGVAPSAGAGTGVVIPTQNSPTPTNGKILKMQYIGQYQSPWGSHQIGTSSGHTIQDWGCLMCSSMMLSSFYNNCSYTDTDVITTSQVDCQSDGLFKTTSYWSSHNMNDSKYKQWSNFDTNNVFDYVKKHIDVDQPLLGNVHGHWCNQLSPAHTKGQCPSYKKGLHPSNGGHYFVIIGYDTKEGVDYIVVHDPGKGDGEYKYIAVQYWDRSYIGGSCSSCGCNGAIRACETK